ncbi:hypothetical protein [Microcystis phage Mel-JY03]
MTARPATAYCIARTGRTGKRWLLTSTLARTKAEVRQIYLSFYVEEYRSKILKELRSGKLEIVRVTITETQP